MVEESKKSINEEEGNVRGFFLKKNNKQVSSLIREIRVILTKDRISKK